MKKSFREKSLQSKLKLIISIDKKNIPQLNVTCSVFLSKAVHIQSNFDYRS